MNSWMNELMDRRMNEVNEQMNEQTNERKNERTNKRVSERTNHQLIIPYKTYKHTSGVTSLYKTHSIYIYSILLKAG